MTKAQEFERLREFTQSLPKDTYLRPWLEEIMPEVEHEITCDFMPTPSIRESRNRAESQAKEIILAATCKAETILKEAQVEADRKRCQALNVQSRTLEFLRSTSNQLLNI